MTKNITYHITIETIEDDNNRIITPVADSLNIDDAVIHAIHKQRHLSLTDDKRTFSFIHGVDGMKLKINFKRYITPKKPDKR